MSQVKEPRNQKTLTFNQQELRDLTELIATQVVANQNNPTSWYWLELGQRINRHVED